MRVFIAIDIDEQIRTALRDLQQQLQNKVDIKRKIYEIATATNVTEQVRQRAIDLLYELSGLRKKIIA